MPRSVLRAGFAILILACAGCTVSQPNAPVQAYSGLERPESEVAMVECGLSTRILAIDGEDDFLEKSRGERFSLLPGRHSFRITLAPNAVNGGEASGKARTITFDLKAGHVYDISVFPQPVGNRAWGIVVADRTANTEVIDPYLARQ